MVGGLVTWLLLRLNPEIPRLLPMLASAVLTGAIGLLFLFTGLSGS
jgi:hypothetical protein